MQPDRLTIGHVTIDRVTTREALARVDGLISSGRGGFVVTPNIDHIVLAHRDAALRDAYRKASLCLADGQPVLWIARLLGAPLPAKISGSDFIEPLVAYAAADRRRVFLFGGQPAVAAEAERRLLLRHPGLEIVGRDSSHWDPNGESPGAARAVAAIKQSGADLVVVALGCPKQEMWMARYAEELAPAVLIGLGGTLDFVAGAVKRAPAWMSSAGMEWLFRLAQEPRRLAHRYLVRDPQILPIVLREVLQCRRGSTTASTSAHVSDRIALENQR